MSKPVVTLHVSWLVERTQRGVQQYSHCNVFCKPAEWLIRLTNLYRNARAVSQLWDGKGLVSVESLSSHHIFLDISHDYYVVDSAVVLWIIQVLKLN